MSWPGWPRKACDCCKKRRLLSSLVLWFVCKECRSRLTEPLNRAFRDRQKRLRAMGVLPKVSP